jgi:hypothetical protein
MSMIFEFGEMSQAEAFVREVKQRWGLDGMTFDDADKAHEHSLFPWVEEPPIAHIDRAELEVEEQVERAATEFGGKFIGT